MDISEHRWAPAKIVQAANRLIKLKKDKGPWDVIETMVKMWEKTNPREWKSYIIQLDKTKKTGKITNVGGKQFSNVSKDKETGGTLRHQLDIPLKIVYMVRRMYPEMKMDEKFYKIWAKKFPKMVVSKKV